MGIDSGRKSAIVKPAGPITLRGGADYGMEARSLALFQLRKADDEG